MKISKADLIKETYFPRIITRFYAAVEAIWFSIMMEPPEKYAEPRDEAMKDYYTMDGIPFSRKKLRKELTTFNESVIGKNFRLAYIERVLSGMHNYQMNEFAGLLEANHGNRLGVNFETFFTVLKDKDISDWLKNSENKVKIVKTQFEDLKTFGIIKKIREGRNSLHHHNVSWQTQYKKAKATGEINAEEITFKMMNDISKLIFEHELPIGHKWIEEIVRERDPWKLIPDEFKVLSSEEEHILVHGFD